MRSFSEHYKKDHALLQVDARVKLLVAFVLLVMVLSYHGWIFPLVMVAICLGLCLKMKVPLKVFLLRFAEPLFIVAVLVTIKFLFTGRDELFSLNVSGLRITGHRDGLAEGLMIGSRILGAVSVVAVLGFATAFTDFMAGVSWFRVPRGFVEIVLLAYRYIFVLFEEAAVIYQAQKNRLGYSSLRRGLSSFGTLAGSLTIRAFDHSQNTTVAMVQRGFDGSMPMARHKPFRTGELLASAGFLVIMGVVWTI